MKDIGNEIDRWPATLAQRPAEQRGPLLNALYREWINGDLDVLTGSTERAEHDRHIGRALSSVPETWADDVVIECVNPSPEQVRRWCWGRDWFLMPEDEDLLLMNDDFVPLLLTEAERGCTKRDYVLAIVEHHARDTAHQAAFQREKKFRARLRTLAGWLPLARNADAGALVTYLERLSSYLDPHEVMLHAMEQRVLDLRRCDASRGGPPDVKREGAHWVGRLDHANVTPGDLYVEAASGKMWAKKRAT